MSPENQKFFDENTKPVQWWHVGFTRGRGALAPVEEPEYIESFSDPVRAVQFAQQQAKLYSSHAYFVTPKTTHYLVLPTAKRE